MGVYREEIKKPKLVFTNEWDRKICQVNTRHFFRKFARFHLEFLQELADRCKEQKPWPMLPTHICDMYDDEQDKQVALLLTMAIKWDTNRTERQIRELRELAGLHPWEWFESGAFRAIAHGDLQEKVIDNNATTKRWQLVKVLDDVWSLCFDEGRNLNIEDVFLLHPFVPWMQDACSGFRWGDVRHKASVIEMVMRTRDGMGLGLWTHRRAWGDPVWLPTCPGMRQFVALWLPECPVRDSRSSVFKFDEVSEVFGLKGDYDLFYAYLGWEAMSRRDKAGCARYATIYHYRYSRNIIQGSTFWTGIRRVIPEIEF